MDLASRWPLPGATWLRDQLVGAYADPARGYHDLRHLTEVLDRLDELHAGGTSFDPGTVAVAAWFHDAVYDGRPEAEERSARWAEQGLRSAGLADDAVSEVVRLVRLTEQHDPGPGDDAGAALCDADLGILAAEPGRYAEYVDGVRREYSSVPEPDFRSGRARVLAALLARVPLFSTPYAVARWEPAARRNVTAELAALTVPPGPPAPPGPPGGNG